MQLVKVGAVEACKRLTKNLVQVARMLTMAYVNVDAQGNLSLVYAGSQVRLRSDGNVDVLCARNFVQMTRGLLHQNPMSLDHDDYVTFEALRQAYPELYEAHGHAQHPATLALGEAMAQLSETQRQELFAQNAFAGEAVNA